MAIVRQFYEVEDECLGPDKKSGRWEMYLFLNSVVEYSRRTKRGPKHFFRRSRTIKSLEAPTKREIINQLGDFCRRKNVILLSPCTRKD